MSIKGKINLDDIWPQERDFLARPDRLQYVRKLTRPKTCVFCEVQKQEPALHTLCLYKDNKAMVVVNKYPYNTAHLLVIPNTHQGDMLELPEATYIRVQMLIRASVAILKKVYSPEGFNIGLNHGSVAGAGIPKHIHWHIVPRWNGDTNFFPVIAETKVLPETAEQSYERLTKEFKELKI